MIAGLLSLVLIWEAAKLIVALRQGATNFAGVRFERETSSKRYWMLVLLHTVLWLLVLAVLLSLLTGIRP